MLLTKSKLIVLNLVPFNFNKNNKIISVKMGNKIYQLFIIYPKLIYFYRATVF